MTRYWRDRFSETLESEYLFDLQDGPYSDIFVFDRYGIAIKGGNVVKAIYFNQFRGEVVPVLAEEKINDDLLQRGDTFERVTFWDYTGQGDFKMLAAIRSPASIAIYGFDSAINWKDNKGVMQRDDSNVSYLVTNTDISVFETTGDFLVVGCETCATGKGSVRIYSADNIRLTKGLTGVEDEWLRIGGSFASRPNEDGSIQMWFTSQIDGTISINQVMAFQN